MYIVSRTIKKIGEEKAFTLVEMIVSVAIFTIVMLVATGAMFTIIASDKKAESLKSVMDNLNFALESMSRNIRTGSEYSCLTTPSLTPVGDCWTDSGESGFEFTSNQESYNGVPIVIDYYLNGGKIFEYQTNSNWTAPIPITAPDINITSLVFRLVGSASRDGLQPRVLMSVTGTAGTGATLTNFDIQTSLSQRQIDS